MSIEFKRTEHSDILVYWTGRDIDNKDSELSKQKPVAWRKFCLKPIEKPSLIADQKIVRDYIQRLKDILKYGLWMTEEKSRNQVFDEAKGCSVADGRCFDTSGIVRICFTELKLSQARQHAYEYGRLGIGVKRMFLFERAGQPLIYLGPMYKKEPLAYKNGGYEIKPYQFNWLYLLLKNRKSPNLQSLFKYMGEMDDHLNYKYYSESE